MSVEKTAVSISHIKNGFWVKASERFAEKFPNLCLRWKDRDTVVMYNDPKVTRTWANDPAGEKRISISRRGSKGPRPPLFSVTQALRVTWNEDESSVEVELPSNKAPSKFFANGRNVKGSDAIKTVAWLDKPKSEEIPLPVTPVKNEFSLKALRDAIGVIRDAKVEYGSDLELSFDDNGLLVARLLVEI